MNKRGHERIIVLIIVFAVLSVGVILVTKSPTGSLIQDLTVPIEINDFNAVYDADGKVSINFALKSYENIEQGLTGKLKIIIQSYSEKSEYSADFFFDGAFAKLQNLNGKDTEPFPILNPEGTLVLTNSINNQASILSRFSFISPEFRGGPNPPENLAVTIQFINYNKIYQGTVIIPFSEMHTSGKYYTANNDMIEIDA